MGQGICMDTNHWSHPTLHPNYYIAIFLAGSKALINQIQNASALVYVTRTISHTLLEESTLNLLRSEWTRTMTSSYLFGPRQVHVLSCVWLVVLIVGNECGLSASICDKTIARNSPLRQSRGIFAHCTIEGGFNAIPADIPSRQYVTD